jgi:hydroxymethylpyrimidine/phosphomethylpyrimidine kinase
VSTNKQSTSEKSAASTVAIALTIAGSDSGGGAGIQADLKTFSALGVYGASVITALTAQNTRAVNGIHDLLPAFVVLQLETVLDDMAVRAIKIGMLSSVAIIEAVAAVLRKHPSIPVVLDPVMVAKSGDKLLGTDAHNALLEHLIPLATVLTPNVPEAAFLLDLPDAQTSSELELQAKKLIELGCRAVLMKGGHMDGATCEDLLFTGSDQHSFTHPRIQTKNTHGTGCTLSSAIAAGLAKGDELAASVSMATDYVHQAIMAADELNVGQGHGPVHHFYAMWPRT